ncbi:hypothetical protein [Hyphomicrobium sp. DY-1]|uniref:hypothetical protein n=1 Tax=Hyphomicrobium sp. DY-1 TaxID=3075650 RepID=UPI0039C01A38
MAGFFSNYTDFYDSTSDEAGQEYELTLCAETAKAWGVVGRNLATIWLPKSACSRVGGTGKVGEEIQLMVPDWLAEQKGLA